MELKQGVDRARNRGPGSLEILDMLRAAGADDSAWVQEVSLDEKQFQVVDAYLSTSSLVDEAIAAGQQPMPLSYAIARCDLNDSGVQKCLVDLLSHPQLDENLRTPIFEVHPLHFATAHHNPELLPWLATFIPGGYGSAGTTSLGHALLHIAALPFTAHQISTRNPDVARRVHCARTLDSK